MWTRTHLCTHSAPHPGDLARRNNDAEAEAEAELLQIRDDDVDDSDDDDDAVAIIVGRPACLPHVLDFTKERVHARPINRAKQQAQ